MLTVFALLVVAAGPSGILYNVDPAQSQLQYRVVHKLHEVDAVTHAVEAKALLAADGTVQVMARAAVASFKSGAANRDEHMLEVTEAGTYPYITFKAAGHVDIPTATPATFNTVLEGELEFHGVRQRERVPLTIALASDGSVHVTSAFQVSLDKYKVERPSLLFVKVDDACAVTVDLLLKRVQP